MSLNAIEIKQVLEHIQALKEHITFAEQRLRNPKIKGWVRSYQGQDLECLLEGMNWIAMDESQDVFAFEVKPKFDTECWDVKTGALQPLFDSLVYQGKAEKSLIRVRDLLGDMPEYNLELLDSAKEK